VRTAADIDPSLAIRDGDIRRVFPPAVLSLGRSYEQRGRVQELVIGDRGAIIRAITQGTRSDPYVQNLKIARCPTNGLRIAGACSCPEGRGCKHLAAVLLAACRRESAAARQPAAPGRPPQVHTAELDEDVEEEEATEVYPPSIRTRVYYVLEAAPRSGPVPRLHIDPMTVALRRDNSPGSVKRYAPQQVRSPAKYLRPSDKLILNRLAMRPPHGAIPAGEHPSDTLHRILATGRARWGNAEGMEVTAGPERAGDIVWTPRLDGTQQAALALDEGLIGLRMPMPWYFDPKAGIMGPVALDVPPRLLVRVLEVPSVPADMAAEVQKHLSKRQQALKTPVMAAKRHAQPAAEPMRPHLRLLSGTLPSDPGGGRGSSKVLGRGLYAVPLARLSYRYGKASVQRSVVQARQDVPGIECDRAAEAAALEDLKSVGFEGVNDLVPVNYEHAHTDDFALREGGASHSWLQFVSQDVPRLRDAGWAVDIDDDFQIRVVSVDMPLEAELTDQSGIDWIEMHLGVEVDGEKIDLVPALISLLQRPESSLLAEGAGDKPFLLTLEDGRMLSIPMDRIRPTYLALLELWSNGAIAAENGTIGLSRNDAVQLAALEERAGLVWRGGEAIRELGARLRLSGGIPRVPPPESFLASLRPYQAQGVDWMQFLASAGLGGILADDMGLGKTVQTLAHMMIEREEGRLDLPSLIVCPTSLIPNWLAEAQRFAPDLTVLALHGPARKSQFDLIPIHDLVLTTYPLLARDAEVLLEQDWHAVILDEAQSIKNPNAETTRQVLRLKARQRFCLSGTPLQNHLGELWSLFDFLAPGFLGSQKTFRTHYRLPIEKGGDAERQEALVNRIKPFMLRRTKEEVAKELPPKTEINEPVELEDVQRSVYEAIRLSMHDKVRSAIAAKGLARSGIVILDALLKMRQACCDPRLLKMRSAAVSKAGSAKLERLMEMLGIMFQEGRRVLVFSQFTEMLALIETRLQEEGIEYVTLTGDTKDRGAPVRKFQSGKVPLFLISLKAGGVGLNLTAADTVIHYDPWWNPAVEDQATDRAYRIGQTKKVFVHRLITLGTIEEKMEELKEKKRAIVASVMDAEHGGALKLTEADIDALFGPPRAAVRAA
jgi:superfamily II DNA or RNA helicase